MLFTLIFLYLIAGVVVTYFRLDQKGLPFADTVRNETPAFVKDVVLWPAYVKEIL
jgi:hypothetical protein